MFCCIIAPGIPQYYYLSLHTVHPNCISFVTLLTLVNYTYLSGEYKWII